MNEKAFLKMVQSHVARVAVGPSAVRGRGNAGTVAAARGFLRELDLAPFATEKRERFQDQLDSACRDLLAELPRSARHWGIARKVINLFLRDCLYTTYFETAYDLSRGEPLLELPLDSITGNKLKELAGVALPRWPGVKYLDSTLSERFQQRAAIEADKEKVHRVHLDALWWSVGRDNDAA